MVKLLIKMVDVLNSVKFGSYNCRGYNQIKQSYISKLLTKCDFLLLQEHWLSDGQLTLLGNISSGVLHTGISGFDTADVLRGRPYGGCAILWHAKLLASVVPIDTNSSRICAARVVTDNWKLLLINVYMPFEDNDEKTDEFVYTLSLIEDIIGKNADCHVVLGGDFNVDFTRNWTHTVLLNSFCDSNGLQPTINHINYHVDFSYNFNMERFNVLDHFTVSGTLYDQSIDSITVFHDIDNISDHEFILFSMKIDIKYIGVANRVYTVRQSWVKATANDFNKYRLILSDSL